MKQSPRPPPKFDHFKTSSSSTSSTPKLSSEVKPRNVTVNIIDTSSGKSHLIGSQQIKQEEVLNRIETVSNSQGEKATHPLSPETAAAAIGANKAPKVNLHLKVDNHEKDEVGITGLKIGAAAGDRWDLPPKEESVRVVSGSTTTTTQGVASLKPLQQQQQDQIYGSQGFTFSTG